jgi:hypothetical protein
MGSNVIVGSSWGKVLRHCSSWEQKIITQKIKNREKYKISHCGLLDLQFTPCDIKMNLKVPVLCKKKTI